MEKKSVFASIALCFAAALLSCGAIYFGYFSFPKLQRKSTIDVKGLVERNVTADRAVILVRVEDEGDDVDKLIEAVKEKKGKMLQVVKNCGIENAIIDEDGKIENYTTKTLYKEEKACGEIQIYRKWETIKLKTCDIESAKKLVREVKQLCQVNRGIEIRVAYEFLQFQKMKKEMLCDAIANAREMADLIAKQANLKIIGLDSFSQGYVSITAADECEVGGSYDNEQESFEKKLRMVVHAGFKIASNE